MQLLRDLWVGVGGSSALLDGVRITNSGSLPSVYRVTDLAAASIGVAGAAVSELISTAAGTRPAVHVDRCLSSMWFGWSLRPQGWQIPPVWDRLAGNYPTQDGWVRLHTNAPHHRRVALDVLGCSPDRASVAHAVSGWMAENLETAVVERGGCAAKLHTAAE